MTRSRRGPAVRSAIRLVEPTAELAIDAAQPALPHALGAADALHLASALAFVDTAPIVATWDARLHAAARASGPATMPA